VWLTAERFSYKPVVAEGAAEVVARVPEPLEVPEVGRTTRRLDRALRAVGLAVGLGRHLEEGVLVRLAERLDQLIPVVTVGNQRVQVMTAVVEEAEEVDVMVVEVVVEVPTRVVVEGAVDRA